MSAAIRASLSNAIRAAFARLGLDAPEVVSLERPARKENGDWSSNAALAQSKAVGRNPRELAAQLVEELNRETPKHVTAIEIAGPGFINFRLADSWLHDVIDTVLTEGVDGYARTAKGSRRTINIEYVSANPTGPLHAGHARWAAYGDALSRVLARNGHVVHREFYINDRGVQMQRFGESLALRKSGKPVPDGFYQGQYIADWAAEMPAGVDPIEWGYARALQYQKDTLKRMHVEFDTWSSERAIAASGIVESTLDLLRAKGSVYDSTGMEPDTSDDGPHESAHDTVATAKVATWLRTTEFGDDKDRVLIKGDSTYTYFTPDIAYHLDKFNRGDLLIDVWGADHHGYVRRMKAAIQCLGHAADELEILIGQNCVLMQDGVELTLSKRTGDLIELAEIIDEVGPDVAKLTFLLQSIDTRQTVDLGELVSASMDNPVHYVHYAHARVYGISRKAAERGIVRVPRDQADLALLTHARELEVARVLGDLPDVVALAGAERAPHKITTWVRELAAAFQGFYRDCPVLRDDVSEPVRQARFWLVESARIGLAIGLDLLGVSAPESMARDDEATTGDELPPLATTPATDLP